MPEDGLDAGLGCQNLYLNACVAAVHAASAPCLLRPPQRRGVYCLAALSIVVHGKDQLHAAVTVVASPARGIVHGAMRGMSVSEPEMP